MWNMSNILVKAKYFVNIDLRCLRKETQAALKKTCNALLVLLLFNLEQCNVMKGNLIYTSLDVSNLVSCLLTKRINKNSPGILLITP